MTTSTPKVWLITGSNRGLGLTFATHLASSPQNIVLACVRSLKTPSSSSLSALTALQSRSRSLHLLTCDTSSPTSIATLPEAIKPILAKEGVDTIDFVLNNAAINAVPDAGVLDIPESDFALTMGVNVLGPAKVVEVLVKAGLLGSDGSEELKGIVMNMTSGLGSLSLAILAPKTKSPLYSISKAAVNMLSVHQARELEGRGVVVVCVDPGWVKTDMGGKGAILYPDESIGAMLKLLNGLTKADTGKYYRYDGSEITW